MKLLEANQLATRARAVDGPPMRVLLATGFTPLSLETYVAAHLATLAPHRKIIIEKGEYADLLGTLRRSWSGTLNGILCFIEWADLDSRLSARSTARHTLQTLDDIVADASRRAAAFADAIVALHGASIVVSAPSLSLVPIFLSTSRTVSAHEAKLLAVRADLVTRLAANGVAVLADATLATLSPLEERWSLRSELEFDFPYSVRHADAMAREMAHVLVQPPRKKGLVVDLDNTLWAGIVGDDGVANVSWELASHSQHHAFFQRLLNLLAESGILVGIASKNDAAVAEEALNRPDLLVDRQHLFPVLANWGAKSESVRAIARAWNVAENSLVFVDDSELEREEVARSQPGIDAIAFPVGNVNDMPQLMQKLRDYFGVVSITAEDRLRVASMRSGAELAEKVESNGELSDEVLAGLEAKLRISERTLAQSARALQLINKTNQFNTNGKRWEASELSEFLNSGGKLISVEYGDRYGHLGEISSVLVKLDGSNLQIDAWVLSCRAFARRIEYATIQTLVSHFQAQTVRIDVKGTGRNGPALRALAVMAGTNSDNDLDEAMIVTTADLSDRLPKVFGDITTSFVS